MPFTSLNPRSQIVPDPHDVSKLPSNTEASRESRLSSSPTLPKLPTCWRCTILKLECNGISPCNACIGLDPPRSCGYKSLAEHTSLILWDEFEFLRALQWRGPENRSFHITFTDAETVRLWQNDQYQIILRRRTMGQERPITHRFCPPHKNAIWNPTLVMQGANALVDHSNSPEAFNDPISGPKSTLQGLLLLESCCEVLEATNRMFTAALFDDLRTRNIDDIRGLVSEQPRKSFTIKNMIKGFLADLCAITVKKTPSPRPSCVLEAYYGILLLYMVRSTLRSILRYSECEFKSFGHQANQDHSFERGVTCTLYQPVLAVLESSTMTFGEMLLSLDSDEVMMTAVVLSASSVIRIPDPMNATPLQHILFFFEQAFPAQVASTGKSVESAVKKPSEHLAAADPSTYVDPSTYMHLPG